MPPNRLYAEAFWLTVEERESGRGGMAGVTPGVVVDAGAERALEVAGIALPVAVVVGAAIVAGFC